MALESAVIGMELVSLHLMEVNAQDKESHCCSYFSRGFVSYSGLGNLASELTGKWRWQEILMDSWGKDLKEARTKLQSYTQSTQTCSEGKGATKWKLQSHFSYEYHPILSHLDNLQ